MTGRDSFDDEPLDVIELLAEDGGRRAEALDDDERPRSLPRRRIVIVAAVALAAIVAVSLTLADRPDDDADVGIESPSSTRAAPATSAPPRDDPPEITPGPFLASLGGPIAISRNGDLFVLDPAQPAFARLRNAGSLGANVVDAVDGSLLVSDNDGNYVVSDDGMLAQGGTTPFFPSSDGAGWWRADESALTPVGFDAESVDLPPGTRAISAVRDGFLLTDTESGLLVRWAPGSEPVAIEGTAGATVAAVHPDRFAWYGDCGSAACALRVTDVATGQTVTIPTVMPVFGAGTASGRFAPDASRLAVMAATSALGSGEQSELVVVDLTAGTIIRREPLDGPTPSSSMAPYLQPVPFDFTRDPNRIVLADWTGRRRQLVVIDLTTGERQPSNNTLRGITSVVATGVATSRAAAPLGPPPQLGIDIVVAARDYAGPRLTLFDVASSARRSVELRNTTSGLDGNSGPGLVAVQRGFVTVTGGFAEFVAFDGTVAPIGDADWAIASNDRTRAWTFDQRDDGAYDVKSVDGTTGAARPERTVAAVPRFVIGDEFVQLVPASFDRPARIELWNVRTGTSRFVDVDGVGILVAVTDQHAVGQSATCYERGRNCGLRVVNLETGASVPVTTETDAYVAPNSTAGDSLYITQPGRGLVRVDLATAASDLVPGSLGAEQWAAAADGTVVFGTADGVYAWTPGAPDSQLVAPGPLQSENGLQLAAG